MSSCSRNKALTDVGGVYRYFPYFITVSSLVILYIAALLWLVIQQRLLPAIVLLGAFLLWILWLVGLIVVSIQLWGPTGSVNGVCNIAVFSKNPLGDTIATMAWLQQKSICEFAFPPFDAITQPSTYSVVY
jgi:hypothetical protein